MIRAVKTIGSAVSKGDAFEIVGTHIAPGGREHIVIRRTSDGRRIHILPDDLADDEYWELVEYDRDKADEDMSRRIHELIGLE